MSRRRVTHNCSPSRASQATPESPSKGDEELYRCGCADAIPPASPCRTQFTSCAAAEATDAAVLVTAIRAAGNLLGGPSVTSFVVRSRCRAALLGPMANRRPLFG
jgi:hypothetical protein